MAGAYLLTPGTNLPRADMSDEGLRMEVRSHIRMFTKGLDLLAPTFQVHRATQMTLKHNPRGRVHRGLSSCICPCFFFSLFF